MSTDSFDIFAIWKSLETLSPYKKTGEFSPSAFIALIFFLILTVVLAAWFIRRFRKGYRSYKDAMIMSAAMFSFISLNEWGALFLLKYNSELFIYFDMILLYETAVPVCLFAVLIIASNLVLLFKEGFKIRNILALGSGILQIVGLHVAFSMNCMPAHWGGDLFVDVFASMLYIFFSSVFFGLAAIGFVYTCQRPSLDRDYVLVLGCAVFGERVPPLLAARIDKGISFIRKQENKTGKCPLLVVSGGQGPGENISEAEAMRRYAVEKGIPFDLILPEDKSRNTKENFVYSKRLLEERFHEPKGVFSTTCYHVFRSELLSKETGLNAAGLSAPTKWYFIPNAFIREIIAFLTLHKKNVLLLFIFMILIAAVITCFQWHIVHPEQPFFSF